MYLYLFCPSRVHSRGQGHVGGSLATSAAPAVKIAAGSQTELSYGLPQAQPHAAACFQREPSPSLTGQVDPLVPAHALPGTHLLLHHSLQSLVASPAFCWGDCTWSKWAPQGTLGRSCSAWSWPLCQAFLWLFLGLALVLLSLQEPLPSAQRASQVCCLGSSQIQPWWWPKCLSTDLDIPLQVFLRRGVSQSGNPETIPLF